MAVRGEGSGLAVRVGKVEEDIRNLRRLPGAVVPPPLPAPAAAGGGGMREEAWAGADAVLSVGPPKSLSPGIFTWADLTTAGTDPPRIDPDQPSDLTIVRGGYHLVTFGISSQNALTPGRSVVATLRLIRGGLTDGFVFLPLVGPFDDGVPQRDQRTVPVHMLSGDVLLADVYNTLLPASLFVIVTVGVSRIGSTVTDLPMLV